MRDSTFFAEFIHQIDSQTVEVITEKMEQAALVTPASEMDAFYDAFFSPFEDRQAIIEELLQKKNEHAHKVFDQLLSRLCVWQCIHRGVPRKEEDKQ